MAGEQSYETLAELEIIPVIGILLAGYWLWKLKPWQSVKKCIIFRPQFNQNRCPKLTKTLIQISMRFGTRF